MTSSGLKRVSSPRPISSNSKTLAVLRAATEEDVMRGLENVSFAGWPQDEVDLLEFFTATLNLIFTGGINLDT